MSHAKFFFKYRLMASNQSYCDEFEAVLSVNNIPGIYHGTFIMH